MGRNKETKKAPQAAESLPQGRSRKKKTSGSNAAVVVSLTDINQLKESGKQRHLKATRTRAAYAAHVRRGQEWLEGFCGTEMEGRAADDRYSDPEYRTAFTSMPNRHSDEVLALYMTWKGFHENLGKSTVESIRAAFKDFWANA